jgi:hypothetical protein
MKYLLFSSTLLPSIAGIPDVIILRGSPSVCVSKVVILNQPAGGSQPPSLARTSKVSPAGKLRWIIKREVRRN